MKILDGNKLGTLIKTLHFRENEADNMEDKKLRQYWLNTRVLAKEETNILEKVDSMNSEDLFYSRYYWFNQFKTRYFELYGHDEGLEQQSFKMLEDFETRFPGVVNWNIIEQIENNSISAN